MFSESHFLGRFKLGLFFETGGLGILMVNAQQESKFHLRTARVRERNGSSFWGLGGILGDHLGPAPNPKAPRASKLTTIFGVKKVSFESGIVILAGRLPLKWRGHFLQKSGSTRHGQKTILFGNIAFL